MRKSYRPRKGHHLGLERRGGSRGSTFSGEEEGRRGGRGEEKEEEILSSAARLFGESKNV